MPIPSIIVLEILFVFIATIHGEDSFDCTGYEDDSYHPVYDADDCRRYWHCIYVGTVYMHAVKRVCPAGTEFDAALRQCETASQVDCKPPKSPHMPRTKSTTKAWRWKHSRLFSQKQWKPTVPFFMPTSKYRVFDIGDSIDDEMTTTIITTTTAAAATTTTIIYEPETAEEVQVLPSTPAPEKTTIGFSLERFSKDLHALILSRRSYKSRSSMTKHFQPGEPINEAIMYSSTTQQRTQRTRYSTRLMPIQTTTQLPLTAAFIATETIMLTTLVTAMPTTTTTPTTMTATITTTTTTTTTVMTSSVSSIISTTTTILSSTTTTTMATTLTTTTTTTVPIAIQMDMTRSISLQSRIGGQKRRSNMTLYILTSDEHKIRRFSINHTRGFLINCNQLRRRLLGRRRLRDIVQTTTDQPSMTRILLLSNTSIQAFHHNILSLTMLCFVFCTKIIIIT